MKNLWWKLIAPVLILGLGVAAAAGLIFNKAEAKPRPPETVHPLVEVLTLKAQTHVARVRSRGQVQAARSVQLASEIAARVVDVSPQLMPGARFAKGQVLLRLDAREARLALKQQESLVQQARTNLEIELGRQGIAAREFKLLGGNADSARARLALRKPQLRAVELALVSAQSGLDRAQINLERTVLRAPFNCLVVNKQVDRGQYLRPGTTVAKLFGTDTFWVAAAVQTAELSRIEIPGVNAEQGSTVRVWQDLGDGQRIERQGRVLRLGAEIDATTRTAQVWLAIDAPLGEAGELPLLPGAMVEIEIRGRDLEHSYRLPRLALDGGDAVWLVDPEHKLRRQTITIAEGNEEEIIAVGGLRDGQRVVVSPLSSPLEGLPVRLRAPGSNDATKSKATPSATTQDEAARSADDAAPGDPS